MAQNGTKFDWDKIGKIDLPIIEQIHISFNPRNNFQASEFEWKKLIFFRRHLNVSSYLNFQDERRRGMSMYFGGSNENRLKIDSIDAYPVWNAFRDEEIHVKYLDILNSKLDVIDNEEFFPPKGVAILKLKNVQVRNFSGLIQKFNSLQVVTLAHNSGKIDISAILSASKNINDLDIMDNSLTLTDPTHQSESMKSLRIQNCVLDTSIKQNACKVMPNVTDLTVSFKSDDNAKFGAIDDIIPFGQVKTLKLANVNLTLNKEPAQICKALKKLYLVDNFAFGSKDSNFTVWTAFPNLKYLSVHELNWRVKTNKELLTGILRNLPDIGTIELEQFDSFPGEKYNGTFKMTYYFYPITSDPGDTSLDMDGYVCDGVFKNGSLEITRKYMDGQPAQNNDTSESNCKELEIKSKNGTDLDWEEIQLRIALLPKLEDFNLYLTVPDFLSNQFQWKSFLSSRPKKNTKFQNWSELKLYVNGEVVFKLIEEFFYSKVWYNLEITSIDPNPIIKTFLDEGMRFEHLSIVNTTIDDEEFVPPDGVSEVSLQNTHVGNVSNFLHKFKSIENPIINFKLTSLTLKDIQNIDICDDILRATSTNLKNLYISQTNLSCGQKMNTTVWNTTLKTLDLHNCVLESSFMENGAKVMSNLTRLRLSSIQQKINMADLFLYKQLSDISITNASLNFTKPDAQQFNALRQLKLNNCEFDSNFMENALSTWKNLTDLTVDSGFDGTKPTQDFLKEIIVKLPNIERLALDRFDYSLPIEKKGEFKLNYFHNRPY